MKKIIAKICTVVVSALLLCATFFVPASASGVDSLENCKAEDIKSYFEAYEIYDFVSVDGKTVKFLKDCDIYDGFALLINSMADDITLDLNGHTISIYADISDNNGYKLTLKDSIGTGSFVNPGFIPLIIDVSHLIIEGGNYYGGNSCPIPDGNKYNWKGFPAISIGSNNTKTVEIKGGAFYGSNAPTDFLKAYPEAEGFSPDFYVSGDLSAIDVSGEDFYIDQFTIADNVIIKGGNGGDKLNGGHGINIHCVTSGNAIEIGKAQISGGNGITGGDAIHSDEKVKLKLNGTQLTAGSPNGKEINAAEGSEIEIKESETKIPSDAVETPAVNITENGVTVKAEANVFPVGTEIKVEKIETAKEISKIEKTLSGNISNLLCFNISAKADGKTVQPNGKVSVTFEIPDKYNIESLLFYYIPEDGKPEEIKIVKDVKNRTVTAELSHFSTYVMGEKVILIPKTGEINAAAVAVFLAVLSLCGLVFFKKSFYTPRHLLKNR